MEIGIRDISKMGNTPGVWYAVAYFLSAVFYMFYNHNTKKGLMKWGPLAAIGAVLMVFMHLTTGCYGLYYVGVMLVVFILIYSIFHHCLEGDFYKKAYYTIRAFMFGELIASVGWQIYYYGVVNEGVKFDILHECISMFTVYFIAFGIAHFFEKRHARRNRDLIISRRELLLVFVGMFTLYAISNLSYVVTGTPFTTVYTKELFIIRTLIDFTAVIVMYLYHEVLLQSAEKIETEALNNILEMQYSQYQIQQESIALVNQKYHDLKHQLTALKASLKSDQSAESEEYLDQMLSDIKRYEATYSTGNKVLDTMLTSEAMKCQARGIELTCVADGSAIDFMHPMDISALFGNALDNAIESAEKIPQKEERLIHLTVEKQKSFARILVENRYIGKIRFRHNLPVTTKSDINFHGFGVKSMKSIAEKYGGSIRAEAEDGWFKLSILMPIQ